MSAPVDLNARRWATADRTAAFKPVEALREAIRQIEAGEVPADHVVVCFGGSDDCTNSSAWVQAGTFDTFQQYGLLERVKMGMMSEAAA